MRHPEKAPIYRHNGKKREKSVLGQTSRNKEHKELPEQGLILWVAQWLWVPLYLLVINLWSRFSAQSQEMSKMEEAINTLKHDSKRLQNTLDEQHKVLANHNTTVVEQISQLAVVTRDNNARVVRIENMLMHRTIVDDGTK